MSRLAPEHLLQIRSDASDWKTTTSPSAEIAGCPLGPLPDPPDALRLTNVVVCCSRSRKNTSDAPFLSRDTALVASDTNTIYRPVPLIAAS